MRGVNDEEVLDFVEWTREKEVDVRFIEYMPFDGNQWSDNKLVPYQQLLHNIHTKFPSLEKLTDKENDTSKVRNNVGITSTFVYLLCTMNSWYDLFCYDKIFKIQLLNGNMGQPISCNTHAVGS